MADDIYDVQYTSLDTGETGSGSFRKNGDEISGTDEAGGVYTGNIASTITLSFPKGGVLVSGLNVPPGGSFPINGADIKLDGTPFMVSVAGKTVTARVTKR